MCHFQQIGKKAGPQTTGNESLTPTTAASNGGGEQQQPQQGITQQVGRVVKMSRPGQPRQHHEILELVPRGPTPARKRIQGGVSHQHQVDGGQGTGQGACGPHATTLGCALEGLDHHQHHRCDEPQHGDFIEYPKPFVAALIAALFEGAQDAATHVVVSNDGHDHRQLGMHPALEIGRAHV